MRNKRKMLALFIAFLMLCRISLFVTANNPLNAQGVTLLETFDTSTALAYGLTPAELYPFIYPGRNPYPWIEIDTSSCTVGKVYVYNSSTNNITPIGIDTATTYEATKENLYYVTSDQTIVQTDYTGSAFSVLYTATKGNIHNLTAFGNILYFIEDGTQLVFLDTVTGNVQLILTENDLMSAFVFNSDKLVWYNSQDEAFYYNITTGQTTVLSNQYEVNVLITQHIAADVDMNVPDYTPNSTNTGADGYNDITFPLDDYPAVAEVGGFVPSEVLSRFRLDDENKTPEEYANSNECDGFAKLAHDSFWHICDEDRDGPSWEINGANTADVKGDTQSTRIQWYDSTAKDGIYMSVEQFYRHLGRGSFVRYVSRTDNTPQDGTHSIVFDKFVEGLGVWVYEAHMDGDYGVGYQLYPFDVISGNYKYILYYVEHALGSGTYEDRLYHIVDCANCDGYLRQSHNYLTLVDGRRRCKGCGYTTSFSDNTIQSLGIRPVCVQ